MVVTTALARPGLMQCAIQQRTRMLRTGIMRVGTCALAIAGSCSNFGAAYHVKLQQHIIQANILFSAILSHLLLIIPCFGYPF
jgi:hypothetical protein